MKVSSTREKIELAVLLKLINRSKVSDIRAKIKETSKRGGSLRTTKKRLAISRDRMYALIDESGNIVHNIDEIVKVTERFYVDLYASKTKPGNSIERTRMVGHALRVTKDEVEKAFKGMKGAKAAVGDGITVDVRKDGGDILLEKLAKVFSEYLNFKGTTDLEKREPN